MPEQSLSSNIHIFSKKHITAFLGSETLDYTPALPLWAILNDEITNKKYKTKAKKVELS